MYRCVRVVCVLCTHIIPRTYDIIVVIYKKRMPVSVNNGDLFFTSIWNLLGPVDTLLYSKVVFVRFNIVQSRTFDTTNSCNLNQKILSLMASLAENVKDV